MSQTQLWLDTGTVPSTLPLNYITDTFKVSSTVLLSRQPGWGSPAELVICGRLGHHVLGGHVDSPYPRATTMAHGTKHSTNVLEAT